MLTGLVTGPAQCEPKEQGCNTKLERRGGVEFQPTSDFVTRPEAEGLQRMTSSGAD